ncbi:MAG: diguanylate cyclase [Solirubrobacterales bacterium]
MIGLRQAGSVIVHTVETNLRDLLLAGRHSPYLTRHRVEAIVTRTRLVAAAFSGLTVLWIALDALTLPWPEWGALAVIRLLAAVVFVRIAIPVRREWTLSSALILVAVMLSVPLAFFVAAQFLFHGQELSGPAAVNARLYDALPFIVMAGLSIFPLVMAEGAMFAVPVLALAAIGPVAAGDFDWARQLSNLWVLVVILGVYAMAGMIQLHYMMALLRRASHDPLTGAFTRRSGMELLDSQFRIAQEHGLPLTVAFFDVDNFKTINDRFGHDEGDKILRGVAQGLNRLLRQNDAVVRWGGEEFIVVMCGADEAGARIALARILKEWLGYRPDGNLVTASIGVAERLKDQVQDWPQLIDLADRRMYQAKTGGKARCVFAENDVLVSGAKVPA